MSTESQQQITHEQALRALERQNPRFKMYRQQDPTFRQADVDFWAGEFLSAIERATEFHTLRWTALQKAQHDMRDPERKMVCDILANGSTAAQPQRSEQQEWTVQYVRRLLGWKADEPTCQSVIDAHRAALAAESEKNAILEKDTSRLRDCIRQGAENIKTLQKQIRALNHEVGKYQALAAERWNQLHPEGLAGSIKVYRETQKKCQRGVSGYGYELYDNANTLLAECYGTIGKLIALLERK